MTHLFSFLSPYRPTNYIRQRRPCRASTISVEDNSETNNPSCLRSHSQNNQTQQKQEKGPSPALIVNKGFWHNWFFLSVSSQFSPVAVAFVSSGSNLMLLFEPTNAFLQQTAQRRTWGGRPRQTRCISYGNFRTPQRPCWKRRQQWISTDSAAAILNAGTF